MVPVLSNCLRYAWKYADPESKPPRYYDKFLQSFDADKLEDVKFSRYNRAMLNVDDSFPERVYRDWETDRKSVV